MSYRYDWISGVFLLYAFLSVNCGSPQPESETLRFYKKTDIRSLDPMMSNDVNSGELCALIFDGLVQFDDQLRVIPNLAEKWIVSEDGKHFTFYLKENVKFSNGRVLTADDVKYSFERVMHPESRSSRKWLFENIIGARDFYYKKSKTIVGIVADGNGKVEIMLKEPSHLILQFLAMPAASIVPREEIDKWKDGFGTHPVGTGPWVLDEWETNNYLNLIPNTVYHGNKPKLKKITYRIIPEVMTATSEFEVGLIDLMKVPDAEHQRWVNDNHWKNFIISQEKLAVVYIGLNNQKKMVYRFTG